MRVEGIEHVPAGPALLVGNHNNGLAGPDILCTLSALWDARGPEAPLYALAHDFAMRTVTVLGAAIARFGALPATRDYARHALATGAQVLVYPGGDLEAYRHFRRRNEIILGPRTGFVTLAQERGIPIIPVVAQGAHRSAIVLHEGEGFARRIGLRRWARLERFPLALALPWGVTAGPWLPWAAVALPHPPALPATANGRPGRRPRGGAGVRARRDAVRAR